MGPPEFTGGNPHPCRHPVCRSPGFNGAAGIHRRKPVQPSTGRAAAAGSFNGAAGIHRRKRVAPDELTIGRLGASMGPPEFTGGNTRTGHGRNGEGYVASMGPPEFTGGNRRDLQLGRPGRLRFNGAAGIHRRKPAPKPPAATSCRVLQWGRRNSPAETTVWSGATTGTSSGFNGAAGIHRRKPLPSAGAGLEIHVASMGPPEFTGGNSTEPLQATLATPCFNGAAGIHRRKRPGTLGDVAPEPGLQWGRRNSPAETPAGAVGERGVRLASMGPPEFTGGNDDVPVGATVAVTELQWGRRNSPAETPGYGGGPQGRPAGFNGAAGIHRRKRVGAGADRRHPHASMGPPEFTGGNFEQERLQASLDALLQWGRRNSPAETSPDDRSDAGAGRCFNGAAGIHRRKRVNMYDTADTINIGFNGAAGIHRRKPRDRPTPPSRSPRASMGPPEFTGGNRMHMRPPAPQALPLQWGRRNSPAETGGALRRLRRWLWASMGPPEFTGGNGRRAALGAAGAPVASMGPPEFTGGNAHRRAAPVRIGPALQWGRRNSPAETYVCGPTRCAHSCFNGAAGIHRRKPPTARSCPLRRPGFNGAAGIHRRKQAGGGGTYTDAIVGFNGAAGIHRRKPSMPARWIRHGLTLQWGRRNSPAETSIARARIGVRNLASMGPPEFTGGNAAGRQRSHVTRLGLQWGRRNSPAETGAESLVAPWRIQASMGPPEFTGGNLQLCESVETEQACASMGPPEFTGGNRRGGRQCADRRDYCFNGAAGIHRRKQRNPGVGRMEQLSASMGPPEFTGGNLQTVSVAEIAQAQLQWGRRNSPAETIWPSWRGWRLRSGLQWGRRNSPAETTTPTA